MLLSISSVVGIAIDVIVIALLAVFGIVGLKKGFFKSIISLFSTIVVLIISIFCASPLANLINKIYNFTGLIAKQLCKGIAGMGAFYSYPIPDGVSGADIVKCIPSGTNGFLKKLMSYALKPLSASDIQGETVAEVVSGAFASIIMMIIAGILLFILIKIILGIASKLFDNISRNRVLGTANRIAGFAFGFAKGAIVVFAFTFILSLLTVIPVVNKKMSPIIQDNTYVVRPVYNFTDKMIGEQIVEGKIVQKWIEDLWENKYKGKGDNTIPLEVPNGSKARPYIIDLANNSGIYSSEFRLNFAISNVVYYSVDATSIDHAEFTMYIEADGIEANIYSSADMSTEIDATTLTNTDTYIVEVVRTNGAVLQDALLIAKLNSQTN